MIRATVSGSFRKHMRPISEAVYELRDLGVDVLSPSDPTIVDQTGEFLFVASDAVRSVRMVQDRHLAAVQSADFLWLVCPDGYVGQSASMEIGFAAAVGTPIFSAGYPDDLTLSHYVHTVAGLNVALNVVRALKAQPTPSSAGSFALDPLASLERANTGLDQIRSILRHLPRDVDDRAGARIYQIGEQIRSVLPVSGGWVQRRQRSRFT